jgi:hypothetical protein
LDYHTVAAISIAGSCLDVLGSLFLAYDLLGGQHGPLGFVTGVVTGLGQRVNPFIEYYADNLPERRLGAFGIGIIFSGFALQSFQYWLALFEVRLFYKSFFACTSATNHTYR